MGFWRRDKVQTLLRKICQRTVEAQWGRASTGDSWQFLRGLARRVRSPPRPLRIECSAGCGKLLLGNCNPTNCITCGWSTTFSRRDFMSNNNKSFQLINTHHVSYIKIGKSNLKYSILFILFLSDGKGSHTYIPVTGPLPPSIERQISSTYVHTANILDVCRS